MYDICAACTADNSRDGLAPDSSQRKNVCQALPRTRKSRQRTPENLKTESIKAFSFPHDSHDRILTELGPTLPCLQRDSC